MKTYTVTLTHTEVITVEAENEEDALEKAYSEAEYECYWNEFEINNLTKLQEIQEK